MAIQPVGQETGLMDAVIDTQKRPELEPGAMSRSIPERSSVMDKVVSDTLSERGIGSSFNVQG